MPVSETPLPVMQEVHPEPISPELTLLWALYDRALSDLRLTDPKKRDLVKDAVVWFRNTKTIQPGVITFGYVIEHCKPSAKLLRLTAQLAAQAERSLYNGT